LRYIVNGPSLQSACWMLYSTARAQKQRGSIIDTPVHYWCRGKQINHD